MLKYMFFKMYWYNWIMRFTAAALHIKRPFRLCSSSWSCLRMLNYQKKKKIIQKLSWCVEANIAVAIVILLNTNAVYCFSLKLRQLILLQIFTCQFKKSCQLNYDIPLIIRYTPNSVLKLENVSWSHLNVVHNQ